MPADFLDKKRSEIGARLKKLEPLVEEYQRLQSAAAALDGVNDSALTTPPLPTAARAPARPAKPSSRRRSSGAHTGRPGRPKDSGTRAAEALALVKASPGITITEMAEKMAIKQNYLYQVLPALAEDGLVMKDGRGWHPKDAA